MRFALLLGSPLRSGVVKHLVAEGLAPSVILTPWSSSLEPMRAALSKVFDGPIRPVKKADVAATLRELIPDAILCVGWPFLFDAEVVGGPWLLLNTHPTALPKYRGPNPWYYVIVNREPEIGVTVHQIDEGMDTGPILHQVTIPLGRFDTYRSLRAKVVELEPLVVVGALRKVQAGGFQCVPQDESVASTYQAKRRPEDSEVRADQSLSEIFDHVRACDHEAFPAYFMVDGQRVNIRFWRSDRGDDHPESV